MGAEDPAVSLLALARAKVKVKGPSCTMRGLLARDPEGVQELLDNTGRNQQDEPRGEGLPYKVAADTLKEAFSLDALDYQIVSRHIRGECSCK